MFTKTLQKSINEGINSAKDSFNSARQSFLDNLNKTDDLAAQSKDQIAKILEQSTTLKSEADGYLSNTLTPAQQEAQRAYDTAKSSYDSYKTKSDEFSGLVSQYDAAIAAGDTELANSLADKANALIPSLNAATDKYNSDFGVYETAKTTFESANQTYVGYVDKLKNLDSEYNSINTNLQKQYDATKQSSEQFNTVYNDLQKQSSELAKQVGSAYETASEYSPIAKDTFEKLYNQDGNLARASNLSAQINSLPEDNQRLYEFSTNFGLRPEDAIEFAPDLSKMSWVAKQTFYESLAQNPDTTRAFNVANKIDSLSEDAQDSFFSAKMKGLDTAAAYNVASVVGGKSSEQQDLYIDTIKAGLGPQLADIFSAAQSLTGPGTKLQDVNEANLAQLKTQEAKDAYQYYLMGDINPNEALALAKGQDYNVLSKGTQFASTTGDYTAAFADTHRWDPVKKEWIPISTEEQPTGGIGGGTGLETGVGVTGTQPYKPITNEEIQQYRAEGVPEEEIQKLVGKYGIYSEPISTNKDYYQQLIDTLFTSPQSKARKLATTTPGTGTGAGTTTGTGAATGTSGTPTGGITTGGTTPGGSTGTSPTGGTTTGGTDTTGGGGTGTGGTGTGGTGTGGGGFGIGGIGGGGFAIPGGMYGMYGMYGLTGQDATGGIKNLTAGLTERMNYNLSGLPSDQDMVNPIYNAPQIIQQAATGGSIYDPFSTKDTAGGSGISASLTPEPNQGRT